MKHSLATKFLAFVLTILVLGSAIAGMAGIQLLENKGLYINTLDNLQDREYDVIAEEIAEVFAKSYAVDTLGTQKGELPYKLWQKLYSDPLERYDTELWYVELLDGDKKTTEGEENNIQGNEAFQKTYLVAPQYHVYNEPQPEPQPNPDEEDKEEPEIPVEPEKKPEDYLYTGKEQVGDYLSGITTYEVDIYQAPEYAVTVYLREEVLESSQLHLLTSLYPLRYHCIALVVIGLLLFAAGLVYLMWVVGRTSDGKVQPGGLNLIPVDIYALVGGVGIWLLLLLFEQVQQWVDRTGPHTGNLTLLFMMLLGILALPVSFLMALSAQIKIEPFYWAKHSAVGLLLIVLWKGLAITVKGLKHCLMLLPVIGRWIAVFVIMVCMLALGFWAAQYSYWGVAFLILVILGSLVVVLYSGYAFGTLLKGVRKMSAGEFEQKIPTENLRGSFRECAVEMNALSETTMQAVQSQVRAERMKTELITNVSHDIKTPLTSIINFVDLMGKPHSPEADKQYLEVLSRQSNQLKKLIEDLLELSKASSGNLQANIITMDAAETINQTLGEFSDKLEKADLIPVFYPPEEQIFMAADGRMTWRVLSNLLNNAVKYATPGTRVYLELTQVEDKVQISIKNVSREEMRLSAEDLLERFVRGDASRNREGSGLGLNIAKSLMEVQQGSLQLTLDGDLFKVTLTFPSANP